MNRDEQLRRRRPALRVYLLAAFALTILSGLSDDVLAQSQWGDNGANIYNTNSGNVGIGTTTPSAPLEINKSQNAGTTLVLDNSYTTVGNSAFTGFWLKQGAVARFFLGALNDGNTVLYGGPGAVQFWNYANGPMLFATNSVERMRITGAGNVGIGTSGPGAKLEVLGDGNNTRITHATPSSFAGITIYENNIQKAAFNAIGSDSTNPGIVGGANAVQVWNFSSSPIVFGIHYSERMRIDSAGNLGIGTNSPQTKLDVAGQVRSSTGGFVFPDGTLQTTAAVSGGGGNGTITSVTAGAGLTGGGTSGAVSLDIGAGTGLSVAADNISVNYGSTAGTAVQGNTSVTVSAGDGMTGGGSLTLGAGGSVTLTNGDRGSSQNIFKNVANAAGATQFSANSNSDALRFEGTGGTSVTFDATAKKIIINSSTSGSTISAANVSEGQFAQNTGGGNFSFPADVTVAGNIAAKYQDVAEWVPSRQKLSAGTVVVLDTQQSNHVIASSSAYDTRVAGVVSAQPGVILGEGGENKAMIATTGRVKIKVDASRAAIHVGDLLVTSDKEGVAMKSEPLSLGGTPIHRPGTLIGKALEPLEKGTGEILVLLSLQ